MSMSEEIFAPKVDVEKLAHDLFLGIKPKLQVNIHLSTHSKDVYYAAAKDVIKNITDYARRGVDSDDLIQYLANEGLYGYDALRRVWSNLTEEQKKEVIDLLISEIAEYGLTNLFASIVGEFWSRWVSVSHSGEYRKMAKEKRDRILKAAKDYLNGKISFFDMAVEIAKALWPETEYFIELMKEEKEGIKDPFKYFKLRNQVGKAVEPFLRNYFTGVELASYISDDKLRELVRKYLINDMSKFIL